MRLRVNEKLLGIMLVVLGLGGFMASWTPPVAKKRPPPLPVAEAFSPPVRTAPQARLDLARPREDKAEGTSRQSCKVLTVYDGDTLGCDLNGNGRIERPGEVIRLLGIDSPEMHYSRKNSTYHALNPQDQPFAKEASRWLTTQAEGKVVYLEFDRKRHDRYQRSLAYVYDSPQSLQSLNEKALAGGYAKTLFLGKNRRHQAVLEEAEVAARKARKGLWNVPALMDTSSSVP